MPAYLSRHEYTPDLLRPGFDYVEGRDARGSLLTNTAY